MTTADRRASKYPPTPWSAQRLYGPYVRSAILVAILLGFSVGTAMLVTPLFGGQRDVTWFAHTQAHGAAQIFGWTALFIMGIAYHVVPRFRNGSIVYPWPQRLILVAILLGISLRFAGQTIYVSTLSPVLLVASGVLILAGVAGFASVVGRALAGGANPHTPGEYWLWPALAWLLVAATLHLAVVVDMAVGMTDVALVRPDWDAAFVHAAVFGFTVNFTLGVGIRTLTAFLGLQPGRLPLLLIALVTFNVGIVLAVYYDAANVGSAVRLIAASLEAIGIFAFIAGLRLSERRDKPPTYIPGTYARYEWFAKAAFSWLAIAVVFNVVLAVSDTFDLRLLPAPNAAPVSHAVSLGFITMMIMGMASRMLPLFEGSQLPNHRLMDAAFVTLNLSVALRLIFGFIHEGSRVGLAISGTLGFIAVLCFAVPAWRAMLPSSRETYKQTAQLVVQRRMGKQD